MTRIDPELRAAVKLAVLGVIYLGTLAIGWALWSRFG